MGGYLSEEGPQWNRGTDRGHITQKKGLSEGSGAISQKWELREGTVRLCGTSLSDGGGLFRRGNSTKGYSKGQYLSGKAGKGVTDREVSQKR